MTARLVAQLTEETRRCGECQLCCKLLPMSADSHTRYKNVTEMLVMHPDMLPEFNKPAGARCPHQRHHKGCAVYARRPCGCRIWNCQWLANNDMGDQRRPDRSHVVVDIMPDFVKLDPNDGSEPMTVEVIVLWCDPDYPDAHRDPAIRAFLERRGKIALVRFDSRRALSIIPPSMASDGQWHEIVGGAPLGERETWPEELRGVGMLG